MKMDVGKFEISRFLTTLPLFSALSPTEMERVAQGCTLLRLSRGQMVFNEGEMCDALFVVITGQVRLYVSAPNGQEKIIELVSPGQSFAEALMFLESAYILNAQALADSLILRVSKETIFQEIQRDSRFAMHMLAGISRRLHGLVRDVESYALRNGMQRLIGYLLRDVQLGDATATGSITVSLPASKASIASRLSLTPEYLSRVLHELESKGLVEIDKRDIRIPDVERLARHDSNEMHH